MTYFDNIPEELTSLSQWVCSRNGSKMPLNAKTGKAASSSDPNTWSDFKAVRDVVESGKFDNPGFVFNNNGIVGIDIDCGFDEKGLLSDLCMDIMSACGSFTEKSRSGRGVHIYIKGDLPFGGRNNGSGVEIYKSGRYFIVTGKTLVFGEIVENQKAIDYVVEKYFPEVTRAVKEGVRNPAFYKPTFPKPAGGKIAVKPTYPSIMSGSRNQSLTSLAGQLHSRGYSKEQIYDELLRCNEEACKPKLPQAEIRTIVNSIMRYQR